MNKSSILIASLALIIAPCVAQAGSEEAAATADGFEERIQALEETIDQMKRDGADASPLPLTQPLDWGKGWSIGANMGTMLSAPSVGIDVSSPLILKRLRVEATTSFWAEANTPEPISNPETEYIDLGTLAGLRLSYYSPLFLNFTRVYCGLGADYVFLFGTLTDGPLPEDTEPHYAQGITTEMFAGIVIHTSKRWSSYVELVSDWIPIGAYWWIAEEDEAFFSTLESIPGKGMGVTLKCGLRYNF
jgi:hypothetical protein